MNAIYFRCENCNEHITASIVEAETKVVCPYCSSEIVVPKVSDPDLKKLYEKKRMNRKNFFGYFIYFKYIAILLPLYSIINSLIRLTYYPTIEAYIILDLIYTNLSAIFVGGIFYLACLIFERIRLIEEDTAVLNEVEFMTDRSHS